MYTSMCDMTRDTNQYVHIHIHIHIYTHTCLFVSRVMSHIDVLYTHTYIYTYIHIHILIYTPFLGGTHQFMNIDVYMDVSI